MNKRVMVAMSGGVDSSVAAFLLANEGYDVTGVTMCLGSGGGAGSRCCGIDAVDDAKRVCEKLRIAHFVLDFSRELEDTVIGKFIAEYGRGRTPNPCIDCNRYLKFGSLLIKAQALGFDYLATGHYAMIEEKNEKFMLKRPKDRLKDQTYFLYPVPVDALGKLLFPLASLMKAEVRGMAKKAGLRVAEKKESQDLCFVDRQTYRDFMCRSTVGAEPGPIVDGKGTRLGTHRGIVFYTIGQRGGLGIAHPVPLYVIAIDAAANRLIVGERSALKAKGLMAGDMNILAKDWPPEIAAKIRYRRKAAPCDVSFESDRMRVLFHDEEEAVTPGQAVVFYHGDYVLGGATIEETLYATC